MKNAHTFRMRIGRRVRMLYRVRACAFRDERSGPIEVGFEVCPGVAGRLPLAMHQQRYPSR